MTVHQKILILVSFVSSTTISNAQTRDNIFDQIRPCFNLMEFIARSEFVKDYPEAYKPFLESLRQKSIVLLPVDSVNSPAKPTSAKRMRFVSSDGIISYETIAHPDGNYLYDYWRSMMKGKGYKTDMRNDNGGSVYLRVKTTTNSAIGALCFTGRNIFSIEIALPFPVDLYDKLDSASRKHVLKQYAPLYDMLDALAKTYVAPGEFIYFRPDNSRLSSAQRLYGLTQFWTEVKYNFAFFDHVPELNWDHKLAEYIPLVEKDQSDAEYYRALQKLCAQLKDGHTNVYPPFSVEASKATPDVRLINIGGKPIVQNVSVSLSKVLPVGSEIIMVDGTPVQEYLETNLYPYISSSTDHIRTDWAIRDLLKGDRDSKVEIRYRTPSGSESSLALTRDGSGGEWVVAQTPWKLFEFKKLPENIAYVSLNSFGDSKIVEEFVNRIDSINECKALIIDLRKNGGGSSTNGYNIIEHLTSKSFLTSAWRTREHKPAFKAWGSFRANDYRNVSRNPVSGLDAWGKTAVQYYQGDVWYREAGDKITPSAKKKVKVPFVVLAGHNTASAAEDFLVALDNLHIAKVVGAKTFGSTGQPIEFKLPGGGSARVCTKRDEYPDGRQFVGYGVTPDVPIENTVEDLINGTDSVLKKGKEIVLSEKK